MKKLLLAGTTVLLMATSAHAEINLICSGRYTQWQPKQIDSNVPPTAATVDLERKRISIFGGEYEIIVIEKTNIGFRAQSQDLEWRGFLDRLTGKLTIMSARQAEWVKRSFHAQSFLELQCIAAPERLF